MWPDCSARVEPVRARPQFRLRLLSQAVLSHNDKKHEHEHSDARTETEGEEDGYNRCLVLGRRDVLVRQHVRAVLKLTDRRANPAITSFPEPSTPDWLGGLEPGILT